MSPRPSDLARSLRVAAAVVCSSMVLASSACSSDEDSSSSSSSSGAAASPDASCKDMCTKTGFSSSRVSAQPNETNCFCSGPGTVTPEACSALCTGLKKGKSSVFKSSAAADAKVDACQCE